MSLPDTLSSDDFASRMVEVSKKQGADIAIQRDDLERWMRRFLAENMLKSHEISLSFDDFSWFVSVFGPVFASRPGGLRHGQHADPTGGHRRVGQVGGRREPSEGDHRGGDARRAGLLWLLKEPRGTPEGRLV